jgi:hypothetical protein
VGDFLRTATHSAEIGGDLYPAYESGALPMPATEWVRQWLSNSLTEWDSNDKKHEVLRLVCYHIAGFDKDVFE